MEAIIHMNVVRGLNACFNEHENFGVIAALFAAHFQSRTGRLLFSNALLVALCCPQSNHPNLDHSIRFQCSDILAQLHQETRPLSNILLKTCLRGFRCFRHPCALTSAGHRVDGLGLSDSDEQW
jgi:hypothetical protein